MNPEQPTPITYQQRTIHLVPIFYKFWKGRKIILVTMAIFFVIGMLIIIIYPRDYTSKVTLLVEPGGSNSAAKSAILNQLSALTGVPNAGSADALTPALYPLVVKSRYFLLEVINQQVTDSKKGFKITLSQYLDKHPITNFWGLIRGYTLGLPGKIIAAVRGKKKSDPTVLSSQPPASILPIPSSAPGLRLSVIDPSGSDSSALELTLDEKSKIEVITNCIKAEIKRGSLNLLEISVNMEDPLVAKELAGSVVITLTRYIIDYRTRKVKNDREFIEGLYAEAEKKYKRAQQVLASYHDRNQNVIQSSARIEGESLQAEYNLTFNIYNSLAQLLEQAKINVQENTPVFTMIEPPSIASESTSGSAIIMIMLFLGFFAGALIVFGKPVYAEFKRRLKLEN